MSESRKGRHKSPIARNQGPRDLQTARVKFYTGVIFGREVLPTTDDQGPTTEFMSTTTVNITAAQVKELREKTGAPMMDCKQALTEAKGDFEQAVVVLRKKGVSVAAKKATRVANEGSVA